VKLSTREEYGLRCLLQVARAGEEASLTIADISRREGISQPNVAKIMRQLRRGGFVRSTRGQAGGYTLGRPAHAISVAEVLGSLGGRLFGQDFCQTRGGAEAECTHIGECSIRPVLWRLQEAVDLVLGALTLAQLLGREHEVKGRMERPLRLRVLPA
jgi:Rrf2 family protein